MRFHPDGPAIPDILLERCDAGRVVFLCGAGVSLPSGMPTFVGLTQHVIDFFDPPADSDIMTAFRPWLDGQSAANVPLDQIFNLLHLEYGKDEVNALVTERLSAPLEIKDFGREHGLIKRISSSQSGVPQIVTTNFDRLFEVDQKGEHLVRHVPPAFPDLNFGSKIEGITYLHGRLVEAASESHPYVLSSADFGRAYLSEGWATNFIRHLLERYTVVLVGYQAEDPPIKYLLQGLNHDGQYDRSRLYAFDRGLPEEIEAKWRDRGVTAIAYSDHPDLWKSMEAWADRADDPRRWRASIIAKSQQDPKDLAPHERGQVAHVLRTVQGARSFSEADPAPHPEWVCVMDANVRSGKRSSSYGGDAEIFDPVAAYGLDDDLGDISEDDRRQGVSNDNLLVWRNEDDNPPEFHRLGGRQVEGFEATPIRLGHLITWVSKSIDSPALAWWAVRQNGLHPQLLQQFEWQVEHSKALNERARHIWSLILEYQRPPRNRQWNGEWFDLKRRINAEGWTAGVLRDFRKVTTPRLQIKPPFGLGQSRPPSVPWEEIHLGDLGQYEVEFLKRHNEELDIPDDLLPQVFGILVEQLVVASGLLGDIETVYFRTPSCYPGREIDGKARITEAAEIMAWFVQLFDRMAAKWPELAKAHATTWPVMDQFFFRKLKLYALSKVDVFDAEDAAEGVLSLDQETFWDAGVVRELLFLLVDRWREFSQESRNQLINRILTGPDQRSHWTDEECHELRDELAARYARYLELQGCELTAVSSQRLAEMIGGIRSWSDAWATSTVVERGSHTGWVNTDEKPDAVLDLPVNEIVSKAKEELKRDFGSFTEKRPFTGLVKANPRKALSALTIAGRADDYPEEFWSSMINELPADITPRLRRVFLNRVARLPHAVIAELHHTLGRWLQQNLVAVIEFDQNLGWAVYDHIVDGILSGGADALKSGPGEVRQAGKVIQQSRRTLSHAINGPVGMCAQALFNAVSGEEQEAYSLIPDHFKSRIERLFTALGEGSDHAVCIASRELNWLMFVDPAWTKERLIPMLAFEHPASEPAWNGFLHSGQVPRSPLREFIKPLLLDLFPWIEGVSWDNNLSTVAAEWLGYMRVFYPNEPNGLSQGEMRSVFRAMSDATRHRFIFWLGQVGQNNESGWTEHVIPLINMDWPRERRYRTSASMRAWVGLLDDTDDCFPAVYEAVKKFLVPVETNEHPFYRFTREISDEKPITALFPEVTLDLINRVTPQVLTRPPYQLPKVLALIAETEPDLTSDPRYLRLIELVERS
ncbi:SIR2 family protein [Pseudomonas chlororaphis]|uniref:SIR2 family protein n=1 Tax=Pseudomonas chlororaphis TaxID=587753 RepID=UPI0023683EF1|nr:SIR2 family protein [Pseudomonas chlororaphis]WDG77768.1 SIR2 family protein [Pseudomonas chlororaphis]WDG82995.1 SIR2 family protein [Pseudomonas chlororaphis]